MIDNLLFIQRGENRISVKIMSLMYINVYVVGAV